MVPAARSGRGGSDAKLVPEDVPQRQIAGRPRSVPIWIPGVSLLVARARMVRMPVWVSVAGLIHRAIGLARPAAWAGSGRRWSCDRRCPGSARPGCSAPASGMPLATNDRAVLQGAGVVADRSLIVARAPIGSLNCPVGPQAVSPGSPPARVGWQVGRQVGRRRCGVGREIRRRGASARHRVAAMVSRRVGVRSDWVRAVLPRPRRHRASGGAGPVGRSPIAPVPPPAPLSASSDGNRQAGLGPVHPSAVSAATRPRRPAPGRDAHHTRDIGTSPDALRVPDNATARRAV